MIMIQWNCSILQNDYDNDYDYDYNSVLLDSILIHSTSNTSTASGGMVGGTPDDPYAKSGGMTSFLFSPAHIASKP